MRPVRSLREPTRYHTQKLTTGAVCISRSKTVRPLASRVLCTSGLGLLFSFATAVVAAPDAAVIESVRLHHAGSVHIAPVNQYVVAHRL